MDSGPERWLRRRRQRRRRWLLWGGVLLALMWTATFAWTRRPPPPLSWVIAAFPAAGAAVQDMQISLDAAYRAYLANRNASRRADVLAQRLTDTQFELLRLQRELARARRITQALDAPRSHGGMHVGKVVLHDAMDRYRRFWVETTAAVSPGATVFARRGLVGRTVRRTGRFSQVLLVHDVESAVDVVSENGVRAIVAGTGGRRGRIEFVPSYESLTNGARLYTTGLDAVFAPDLYVGTVTGVSRRPEELFLSAGVIFAVDPADVRWVRLQPRRELPDEVR